MSMQFRPIISVHCVTLYSVYWLWKGIIYSVRTGPGPSRGPFWSKCHFSSILKHLWTRLGPHAAFVLLFLFILCKPHFTSATKKKVTDVTARFGRISYIINE